MTSTYILNLASNLLLLHYLKWRINSYDSQKIEHVTNKLSFRNLAFSKLPVSTTLHTYSLSCYSISYSSVHNIDHLSHCSKMLLDTSDNESVLFLNIDPANNYNAVFSIVCTSMT
jgi:hypothetical protein